MQMAIDSGNLQEIQNFYNEVLVKANHKARSDKYLLLFEQNIEDCFTRSLGSVNIVCFKYNGRVYSLEVKDTNTKLPIELGFLVRIMSVLLNNAVEGGG